jgi:hypothetical protein
MLRLKARDLAHPFVVRCRCLTVSAFRRSPWVMVWTLAVAQVISWGPLDKDLGKVASPDVL